MVADLQVVDRRLLALVDVDGDGLLDVILAQNDFSPQRETGRMDGGVGLMLRGDGLGGFSSVWPGDSGISIPHDARSLAIFDVNGDRQPDLLFGVNDQAIAVLENRSTGNRMSVRVVGKPGNPTGIGARVTVTMTDGSLQTNMSQEAIGSPELSRETTRLTEPPTSAAASEICNT